MLYCKSTIQVYGMKVIHCDNYSHRLAIKQNDLHVIIPLIGFGISCMMLGMMQMFSPPARPICIFFTLKKVTSSQRQ